MRTLLCGSCLAVLTTSRRDALAVMRAHAVASTHPLTRSPAHPLPGHRRDVRADRGAQLRGAGVTRLRLGSVSLATDESGHWTARDLSREGCWAYAETRDEALVLLGQLQVAYDDALGESA